MDTAKVVGAPALGLAVTAETGSPMAGIGAFKEANKVLSGKGISRDKVDPSVEKVRKLIKADEMKKILDAYSSVIQGERERDNVMLNKEIMERALKKQAKNEKSKIEKEVKKAEKDAEKEVKKAEAKAKREEAKAKKAEAKAEKLEEKVEKLEDKVEEVKAPKKKLKIIRASNSKGFKPELKVAQEEKAEEAKTPKKKLKIIRASNSKGFKPELKVKKAKKTIKVGNTEFVEDDGEDEDFEGGALPTGRKPRNIPVSNVPYTQKLKQGGSISKRADIVRQVMREKGLSMIESSKYVKEHNLYKK